MKSYFDSGHGGFIMSPYYKFDFAFENLYRGPSRHRNLLRVYTGDDISESEAQNLWNRITDHKWYISERLSRDVGFHVAAIDYVENFYEPPPRPGIREKLAASFARLSRRMLPAIRFYFESKGNSMPV